MSYLSQLEDKILKIIKGLSYELEDFNLALSNRPELGDYQINDAMKLAAKYNEKPLLIANKIAQSLKEEPEFKEVSVAGPGFINLSLSDDYLIKFLNSLLENPKSNIDSKESKKIVLDYGGANVAKVLHVGHLRSANIGEALKRLATLMGDETISDVHLGDSGLQSGIVVNEIKRRFPDLICFKDDYTGEEFDLEIEVNDLNDIYPSGALKAKEDNLFYQEASQIALEIQENNPKYKKVWDKVLEISLIKIKELYGMLNTNFDYYYGEQDSYPYIPKVLKILEEKGLSYKSDGALIVDVQKEDDKKEYPPAILVKSNGAYLYEMTDLATIYGRKEKFNPDEIWYVVDKRQDLHFESVFRVAEKAEFTKNTKLLFYGFGTMNGKDGKAFKTREGEVMPLDELISLVEKETYLKLSDNILETKKQKIAHIVAIAALKYADLLPDRMTDYIFDVSKFTDLEGKTGPYILYTYIRMNSLLKKGQINDYKSIKLFSGVLDRKLALDLLNMPKMLNKAYRDRSVNDIAEYIYLITSDFNSFYGAHNILQEKNEIQKSSWISLIKILKNTLKILIDTIALEIPDEM